MPIFHSPGSAVHKSAVLLVSLGADAAARVLSHLDEGQVQILVREMSRLDHIRTSERDRVLEEFHQRIEEDSGGVAGGLQYARRVLEQVLGPERANQLLGELLPEVATTPSLDSILAATPPEQLAALVANEHPQLIALLIGQLPLEKAGALLSALPAEAQGPVAMRLAEIEAPAPIAVEHLERFLAARVQTATTGPQERLECGPRRVGDILGRVRHSVGQLVMSFIEKQAPALAAQVNQFRFTFEFLLELDGRTIQRILRDVDADTLQKAMRGLDEERRQIIYANISERAGARLRDELTIKRPTRLRDVEEAQRAIVAIARALQESGEVELRIGGVTGGDEEEMLL